MEAPETLVAELAALIAPNARGNVMTLGLARGMVWDNGELPDDSPNFSELLTNDLLDHGFTILSKALGLRIQTPNDSILDRSFQIAAESIESAVRKGANDTDRGFYLVVGAAAFHLGHFGARSYSLLQENIDELNLSSNELVLVLLMQRRLGELESLLRQWLQNDSHSDRGLLQSLQSEGNDEIELSEVACMAVNRQFHLALARFEFAIRSGEGEYVETAIAILDKCVAAAEKLRHVPLWWSCILARHLIDDLWDRSLHTRLPHDAPGDPNWPDIRKKFIELVTRRRIAETDLWPSQLDAAARAIDESDSLVVALPTSSGKTRIAELCILKCLSAGRRVIYVTPLRALSAQIEGTLARTFRPLGYSITSVYGASGIGADDVSTMASASIVVATPEKLDFAIRQDPNVISDVGLIVLDEGHMIGFGEREIRYEVLVQRLLRRSDAASRRLVCLSAIFKEGEAFDEFSRWIRDNEDPAPIASKWRPTRQRPAVIKWKGTFGRLEFFLSSEAFVHRFIEHEPPMRRRKKFFPKDGPELLASATKRFLADGHSILIYCPQRRSVEPSAKALLKAVEQGYLEPLIDDDNKANIAKAKRIGVEWLGEDHIAVRALEIGVAVHHGQLPRPFLSEIERLLRADVLPVAVSSPTLAQGVDLNFSVLLLRSLMKRRGENISPKEFANVIGRVGRAFVDLDGIYAFLIHETSDYKTLQREMEFKRLVDKTKDRELESGLFLLIHVCILMLKEYLQIPDKSLQEYVLNQQAAVDEYCTGDSEESLALRENLSDLDAGILTLIEDHNCDIETLAQVLDDVLQNSYWRSRIKARGKETEELQELFIKSRATWLWKSTDYSQRRGFYAAGVGKSAGQYIIGNSDALKRLIESAASAIHEGEFDVLVEACVGLGELLFCIYPFEPDSMVSKWTSKDWSPFVSVWLKGEALSSISVSEGISFIQEAIVFRLVWAVESVRVILENIDPFDDEVFGMESQIESVAVCLTYGVPNVSAARLLESGLESRLLAYRIATELTVSFSEKADVKVWFGELGGTLPLKLSQVESEIWNAFAEKMRREKSELLVHKEASFVFQPFDVSKTGPAVRVTPTSHGYEELLTADFQSLGRYDLKLGLDSTVVGVIDGERNLDIAFFAREQ